MQVTKVSLLVEVEVDEDGYSKEDFLWSLEDFAKRYRKIHIERGLELDDMSVRDIGGNRVGFMDCTIVKG